jgi:creatinine amidohydrolase
MSFSAASRQGAARRIDRMTSPGFAAAVARCDTIILPLGSVEQTGGHCPLGTDLIIAEQVSVLIADEADCLVAPPVPFGDTLELDFWPGTVHVDPVALGGYLEAAARSFFRHGIANVVFFCCHSPTMKTVDLVCRRLNREGHGVCAIDWWKAAGDAARGDTSAAEPFGHGGEVITSVMMALEPGLVDLNAATDEASLPGLARVIAHGPGSAFIEYGDFRSWCRSGAWGEVRGTATAEKGARWLSKAVSSSAAFIREWRSARHTAIPGD